MKSLLFACATALLLSMTAVPAKAQWIESKWLSKIKSKRCAWYNFACKVSVSDAAGIAVIEKCEDDYHGSVAELELETWTGSDGKYYAKVIVKCEYWVIPI